MPLALAARALWIDIFRSFLGKSGLCPEQDEILPARVGGEGKVASGRTTSVCIKEINMRTLISYQNLSVPFHGDAQFAT